MKVDGVSGGFSEPAGEKGSPGRGNSQRKGCALQCNWDTAGGSCAASGEQGPGRSAMALPVGRPVCSRNRLLYSAGAPGGQWETRGPNAGCTSQKEPPYCWQNCFNENFVGFQASQTNYFRVSKTCQKEMLKTV